MNKFLVFVMMLGFCSTSLISPAQADMVLLNHVSGIVATPIGAGVGTIRGALSNSINSDHVIVDGLPAFFSLVTIPVGLVLNTGVGAVSGLMKGAHDGFVIGHDKPLSLESFSLKGNLLDYNVHAWNL
ncbi:MAG: hypothetical protein HOA17_00440 [Candidatus Melainabacteria bacterium]|nr:hypothetical protein [Candidatus Melainabacteria bacterium]